MIKDCINLDRRSVLRGSAGVLVAGLVGCSGGAKDAGGLRVSITGKGEGDVRLLFQHAGLKPDFPISYSEFQSGHLVVEAFNAGSLDFGGTSEIPPVFAAASTIQSFRQIAVNHGDVNNQVVLVPAGSPIRDLSGLKGKRVGYVRATTSQYFLIRMLASVGLKWSDIDPIAMTVSDGAAAFSRGSLDAWAIYGFPIQRALATEGARILKTALGFLSGNYIICAHEQALADREKSAQIEAYLRLLQKGYVWAAQNRDRWAEIIAGEIGVPPEYVHDQFRRQSATYSLRPVTPSAIASQQAVADVFSDAGLIPSHVDVRPLWIDRFNSMIAKEA
ncbi:sulfonate transport system substrate-binding protein [Novosphingobium sp. PhB165]|uniref:ABC transporter substrate-binding protein n=1 Tax=Novosphingobium sp. PhB165 TaxID=2485105 RepID=UPI0010475A13|nr:ABC transporter substrate-binding protein [Novosphingobium sp. PhB165]TCM14199.1 sulfonate transport system substrate-binding protein [Novosphingobium sp. PhB165]